jgi:hypothetical protein
MTDHDLEQRLRAWYRAEIDDLESAPEQLRAELATLVGTAARSRRFTGGWSFPSVYRFAPLALAATALLVAILIGIGLLGRLPNVGPPPPAASELAKPSPVAPSPSATPTPVTGPIVGTWATGEVTCAQQLAALEAAGFSAEQMTTVGVDLTCENGIAVQGAGWGNGSQNTARFLPDGGLVVSDNVYPDSGFTYRLIGASTFEATDPHGTCLTYGYAIEGDQLSIEIVDNGCVATRNAPLLDRIGLTVLFETSPFTRQP